MSGFQALLNFFLCTPASLIVARTLLIAARTGDVVSNDVLSFLPAGSDPAKLAEGLDRLNKCAADLRLNTLQLYGSLLLPTRKLLAQFSFRPWSGVVLSKE